MPLLVIPQPTPTSNTFPGGRVGSARWAVEFSPTTTPGMAPVWVDVTDRVRQIDLTRGRERTLDRFEAGELTLVLDNQDRAFDPSNTASVYYDATAGRTNILPMRMFRVRMQYGANTYYRFTGFASTYEQRYDNGNRDATCVITCHDAFKLLALARPTSPFSAYVTAQQPNAWFRLGEGPAETIMYDSSPNGYDGRYYNNPTFQVDGLITSDPNKCISLNGVTAHGKSTSVPMPAEEVAIGCWFSTTQTGNYSLVSLGGPSRSYVWAAIELSNGYLQFVWHFPGINLHWEWVTTAQFNDGQPHHAWVNGGVTAEGWQWIAWGVDGVLYEPGTGSYEADFLRTCTANTLFVGQRGDDTSYYNGSIDEVTYYVDPDEPGLNLPARINAEYEAGALPWNGQSTGVHVNKLLDNAGWPTDDRDVDAGNSTLQSANYADQSSLDVLQAINLSEQGQLFITQDGRVRFRARHATLGAASAYTFSDLPGVGQRYNNVVFSYDDTLIRNSVTAQRNNGGEVTVADTDSVGRYLTRTYTQTGLLYDTDTQSRDFAQWTVNRYKDPQVRVQSIVVLPERDPAALYDVVGNMELGTLVTVQRTPQGVGSAVDRAVLVEGITETVTPAQYVVEYAISEADTAAYWILGDLTYSVLDATTRLAF